MKLTTTSSRYSVKDESGYEFTIQTQYSSEKGCWIAHVTCSGFGMKTEESAIERCKTAAEQFVRIMNAKSIDVEVKS